VHCVFASSEESPHSAINFHQGTLQFSMQDKPVPTSNVVDARHWVDIGNKLFPPPEIERRDDLAGVPASNTSPVDFVMELHSPDDGGTSGNGPPSGPSAHGACGAGLCASVPPEGVPGTSCQGVLNTTGLPSARCPGISDKGQYQPMDLPHRMEPEILSDPSHGANARPGVNSLSHHRSNDVRGPNTSAPPGISAPLTTHENGSQVTIVRFYSIARLFI